MDFNFTFMFFEQRLVSKGPESFGGLPERKRRELPSSYEKQNESDRREVVGVSLDQKATPDSVAFAVGSRNDEKFFLEAVDLWMDGKFTKAVADDMYKKWESEFKSELMAAFDVDNFRDLPVEATTNYTFTVTGVKARIKTYLETDPNER